jgi:hypothetical protein
LAVGGAFGFRFAEIASAIARIAMTGDNCLQREGIPLESDVRATPVSADAEIASSRCTVIAMTGVNTNKSGEDTSPL